MAPTVAICSGFVDLPGQTKYQVATAAAAFVNIGMAVSFNGDRRSIEQYGEVRMHDGTFGEVLMAPA